MCFAQGPQRSDAGEQCYEENFCINGTVSLSNTIILLLMNRGQAAPHQVETVKELLDSDRRMTIGL